MKYQLNLQQFAEEGEGAAIPATAGAETATAAENTEPVTVNAGDTLTDGTAVSSQVAAEMNKQMARHPELQNVYGKGLKQKGQKAPAPTTENAQPTAKTAEQRWEELKKGEMAEFYGRDVQAAIQDRFKNQADAGKQLEALEPMLEVFRQRAGVTTNEELIQQVMDDDSLYEEAASEAGMTIPAYRQFMQLKQERDAAQEREQQSIQQKMLEEHWAKMSQQAEELKKQVPDFDLVAELQNDPTFLRLTSPEVGVSVEDAYFARHRKEMMPQAIAAGMERAKEQMGQTLQARRNRPVEGAMKARGQAAADFNRDPRSIPLSDRKKIYDLIHKGVMKWG